MGKKIIITNLEDTKKFAENLAKYVFPNFLLTLTGDLGAGKTTFTKYLGAALGVKKTINSPTFTILKMYHGKIPLYHIDAYRLEGISQDLGFEEVLEDDGICVVEWPAFIESQLPSERLEITIQRDEEQRIFQLRAIGKKYEEILEALS